MTSHFTVREHKFPACHIREYAGSTANSQEEILHLHLKQYIPLHADPNPPADAVTVIATHGELYEPLWDELYEQSQTNHFTLRAIWIADTVNLGTSGIWNEDKLSSDYSWMDHARDLLLMINQFRDEMPRPIVGIGHSFGGCQLTNLAYLHPRLFSTLILLDPVIQLSPPPMGFGSDPPGGVNLITYRPDVWPTRRAAAASQAKSSKTWDPRVLTRMVQYGFRDLPTALYPDDLPPSADPADPPVTLTSTKHQDAWSQLRANFSARAPDGRIVIDRSTHADMDPLAAFVPLYRPEPRSTFKRLPELRPSVLWLLGETSYLRHDEMREGIKVCGTGVGGGGGMAEGRVKEVVVKGRGHLFPFEAVEDAGKQCAIWLGAEMERFREEEKRWRRQREAMSQKDHLATDDKWKAVVKPVSAFRAAKSAKGPTKL